MTPRVELLADLSGEGKLAEQWLMPSPEPIGVEPPGERYGFHPAFTALVGQLAGNLRSEGARDFLTHLVAALPDEADTGRIVRRWFVAAWDHGADSPARCLADTPIAAMATAVIAQVRASLAQTVTAKDWRAVRSPLAKAEGLDPEARDYAQVAMAMAWDIDQVPAAAGDVIAAWSQAIMQAALRAEGWTPELSAELGRLEMAVIDEAKAAVGEETDRQVAVKLFTEARERALAASPRLVELSARRQECWSIGRSRLEPWLETARAQLISIAGGGDAGQ